MLVTVFGIFVCMLWVFSLVFMAFLLDELILDGYFVTKLRKRFDVESLK